MTAKESSGPVRGSGDFLRDMGYDDPDEMRVKFTLANTIAMAIEQRRLKQAEVAKLTGLAQPDISRIVNGIVKDYSLIRLMRVLTALGKDVSIGISDASGGRGIIPAPALDRRADPQNVDLRRRECGHLYRSDSAIDRLGVHARPRGFEARVRLEPAGADGAGQRGEPRGSDIARTLAPDPLRSSE